MGDRAVLMILALLLASCGPGTTSVTSWDNKDRDIDCAASYLAFNGPGDFKCSQYGATSSGNNPGVGIFQTFNLLGTAADGTVVNIQGRKSMNDRGYFSSIFDNAQSDLQSFNNLTTAAHGWTPMRRLGSAQMTSFESAANQKCSAFVAPGSPSRSAGWLSYRRGYFCAPFGKPQFSDAEVTSLIGKIEVRESVSMVRPSAAAMPAAVSASGAPTAAAPATRSGAVSFMAPAVGTRFQTGDGYYQITSVDGMNIKTANGGNRTANWEAGFLYVPNSADRRKIESIWPLEPGKSIVFEERANPDAWRHTVTVLRWETVQTVQTPAGKFETVVVDERIESLMPAQGNLDVTETYWYAPDARWSIKRATVQRSGPPYNSNTNYVVSAIVAP
jgi:hypothetical protein